MVEEDGVLVTLFEPRDPAVPEAGGGGWAVSSCETINSLFCLIHLGFLP